jgi:ribonuclease HI
MTVMIFTDGASRGNPGEAGGGFVIYKDKKELVAKSLYYGKKTNNQAEYLAVINALEYIYEHNLTTEKLLFFADSQFLVKQIQKEYKVKAKNIIPLYHKVETLLKNLNYTFQWIPRDDNKRADELANIGIEKKGSVENYEFVEENNSSSLSQKLYIDKAFFGKINCFKLQVNSEKEVYFHMGLINKQKQWEWNKVKMSSIELGEIIHVLSQQEGKCSFFHSFEHSKMQIWCNKSKDSFSIKIGSISKNFSIGEFEVLKILLIEAIKVKESNYFTST